MGQKSSKTVTTAALLSDYNPTYDVVKKYDDVHYGEVRLVQEKTTKKEMILKEVAVNTKKAYDAEINLCQQRAALLNKNIVQMVGYNGLEKKNMCSNLFRVSIFVEVLERTLFDKLKEATTNQASFGESEVLFIAESLISTLAYFQTQGVSHGDIRPVNVFVSPSSTYKLSDSTLAPQKSSDGYIAALVGEYKTLIAPEILKHLPKKDSKFIYDKVKADVFSLGATLLSIATLTNSEDFYNYENGTINEALLAERLEKVRYSYSFYTYELIRDMLYVDELKRTDFVQLDARIHPFRSSIQTRLGLPTPKLVETTIDDDILLKAELQIAHSQKLRQSIEDGTFNYNIDNLQGYKSERAWN